MERTYSKTGEWCFKNGIPCDNHVSTSPVKLRNGEQCMNRFFGACNQGDRFLPHSDSTKPKHKQVLIKQCTPSEYLMPYDTLIGLTFNVESEFSDTVLIKIGDQLVAISLRDCIVKIKKRAIVTEAGLKYLGMHKS